MSWIEPPEGAAASPAEAFGIIETAPAPIVAWTELLRSSRRDNSDPALTIPSFPLLARTH